LLAIVAARHRHLASGACAAALALALLLLPAAGAAEAPSREASVAVGGGSGVGAILSYREGVGGNLPYFELRLQISRPGAGVVYNAPVLSHFCLDGCVPAPLGTGPSKTGPLTVADLEGDGQPDVVLELSTGGAHCCTVVQVFSFDPGVMAYRPVEQDFGDPGALLSTLAPAGGGKPGPVFRSADDRFAYAFTSFAFSGLPIQIWSFAGGRFKDVTRAYPKQIEADAGRQFKGFEANRRQGLGLGLLAAWAADEDMLGHRALVSRTLAREARMHRLRSREDAGPSGGAFVKRLGRFLKRNGYT
jgi:hypothetical protein